VAWFDSSGYLFSLLPDASSSLILVKACSCDNFMGPGCARKHSAQSERKNAVCSRQYSGGKHGTESNEGFRQDCKGQKAQDIPPRLLNTDGFGLSGNFCWQKRINASIGGFCAACHVTRSKGACKIGMCPTNHYPLTSARISRKVPVTHDDDAQ
jgi:hypothetical protein